MRIYYVCNNYIDFVLSFKTLDSCSNIKSHIYTFLLLLYQYKGFPKCAFLGDEGQGAATTLEEDVGVWVTCLQIAHAM